MAPVFANNTSAVVTSGGTTAPSGGTVESWTVTVAGGFPASLTAGQQFHVADTATGMQAEKALVTAVSGSGPYTWTVTRGDEGTTPVAHAAGFTVQQVVTAGELAALATTAYADAAVAVEVSRAETAEALLIPLSQKAAAAGVATLDAGTLIPAAQMRPYNVRGAVQYSTAYSPWDLVLYYGEYILVTASFTTGSGTNGIGQPFISTVNYIKLTSRGHFYASDYGVVGDGTTDNWAALQNLLILVRSLTTNSFAGYEVILPPGTIAISKTIIIPTQTMITGQGLYSTAVKLLAGANCDVMQTEVFNSSAQAALLTTLQSTLTAGNLRNAFRWGLRDLTVHGNSPGMTPGTYQNCLTVTTNPLTSTTGTDPDFDPAGICQNVQFRAASGDGYYHTGRSAARLIGCISWFCQGNAYTPSFDTQFIGCQAGFAGIAGWYLVHGAGQHSGNKSYNNGLAQQWVSGGNYSVLQRVMSGGLPYDAINALTNDTVAPASDPTNWAPVTATSPAAWGAGVYCDTSIAGELTFQCDMQENSAHNWWFHNCTGTSIQVSGVSVAPNWNQVSSAVNSTNPNNYAHLNIDGSNGILAAIACGDISGNAATQFRLRMVNAPVRCDITLTDGSVATTLTPDSITLLGSGNSVRVNGTSLTSTLAAQNDVSISSPGNSQVLTYSTVTGKWTAQSPGTGFYSGIWGDGSDGAVTFDGTTAYNNFSSLAGSTYTLRRDVYASSLTINPGVTVVTGNCIIYSQAAASNAGTISNNGNNASGATAGAVTAGGSSYTPLGAGGSGGAGQTGAGSSASAIGVRYATGNGGAGGTGTGGGGGAAVNASFPNGQAYYKVVQRILAGTAVSNSGSGTSAALCGGGGGGGGGGDGTNKGGGGGGGAGLVVILAPGFSSSGSITANGGNGAAGVAGNSGGGGGGGGGVILIYTLSAWTNSGTTSVAAGSAGAAAGTGAAGSAGTAGNLLNVILQ